MLFYILNNCEFLGEGNLVVYIKSYVDVIFFDIVILFLRVRVKEKVKN